MTVGRSDGRSFPDSIAHLTDEEASAEPMGKANPVPVLKATISDPDAPFEVDSPAGELRPLKSLSAPMSDQKPPEPTPFEKYSPYMSENAPPLVPGQGREPLQPMDKAPKLRTSPSIVPKGNEPGGGGFVPGSGARLGSLQIDTTHTVKSGAVASKSDPGVVYIDPHIPEQFHQFLAVHEETERSLMAPPYSYPYAKAHVVATLAEKHAVEQAGMSWKQYTDAVDPYVAKAEAAENKNPPPDPHINPEDAIGHHVEKASTLEKADLKIGKMAGELPNYTGSVEDRRNEAPPNLIQDLQNQVGKAARGVAAPFSPYTSPTVPSDPELAKSDLAKDLGIKDVGRK